MKYNIIQSFDIEIVMDRVCKASDEGWELYGELVVTVLRHDHRPVYTQTMIKRETPVDYSRD